MQIIAKESYQGRGGYPLYTLALARRLSDGTSHDDTTPLILCQYDTVENEIFTYDSLSMAKDTFALLCDIPGIRDRI